VVANIAAVIVESSPPRLVDIEEIRMQDRHRRPSSTHSSLAGLAMVVLAFSEAASRDEESVGTQPDRSWIPKALEHGEIFLAGLFDPELELLPEYAGAPVFWLYHDNYLAAKALDRSRPDLAAKIRAAIARRGERFSGKIEIVHDEAGTPLPFRVPALVEVEKLGDRSVRTERLTGEEQRGWDEYADLLFLSALAKRSNDVSGSRRDFDRALMLWDGKGFDDPAVKVHGIYATYKLALALITSDRIGASLPMRATILERLRTLQSETGGWITDYTPAGTPRGFANVETTALVLLGLETAEHVVRFRVADSGLAIDAGGARFTNYVAASEHIRRPYFAPLRTPSGFEVTRPHPPIEGVDPTDHADMHPGLWLAFGNLGGADFWRNRDCCRVEHVRYDGEPRGGAGVGSLVTVDRYVTEGRPLLEGRTLYEIHRREGGTLLAIDTEFVALADTVGFGDEEEMGFGVRLATRLLPERGGRIFDDQGREGERAIRGQIADWCGASALIDGRARSVALFAHPENPLRSRVHARDYGLIVLNPFGARAFGAAEESRFSMAKGDRLRLRFAAFVYEGVLGSESERIAAAFEAYRSGTNEPPKSGTSTLGK
jgi:hypothetical protein